MATGHRVLVVDDNAAARRATARVLARAGYDTREAADGTAALAMARATDPHLVLLDVMLPDMQGPEVMRRLRADPAFTTTSVVLMSAARTEPGDQVGGLDAGAEDYIARPISNQELLARVRTQLRQRDLTAQLRASEQRLRSLLESQADGVLVVDGSGTVRFANPAAQALLGRRPDELAGSSFGLPITGSGAADIELGPPGAPRKAAQMRAAPIQWEGEPAWIVSLRDVSEQAALEEQLRRSQRLESLGQLTGGVAHDFNNLLTVILGNAELLAEAPPPDAVRLRRIAQTVTRAAQRGAQLTARLLAFARRQVLDPRAVDINELLQGMEELLQRTLGEHVSVRFEPQSELWPAQVDPAQLESALLNLCLNARDAMPQGGRLTLETRNVELDDEYAARQVEVTPGEYVNVAISDTGTGMAPEILERAFEPFYTTKAPGKGTGLGLAMVYGFVKQSGGHVNVYSEPGHGTTVKLYLPRTRDPVPRGPAASDPGSATGDGETILVVEDDDLVREFAASQLRRLGYEVLEAADGAQALALLEARAGVRLLFTDVVMPGGMSGRDLADAARALRPGLPVLYTSGYTENAIVHHGRLDPGVQLLSKPYQVSELARRVREALS